MPTLSLAFESHEALTREHEANLRHGRAFVAGQHGLALFAPCTLQLVRADTGATLDLEARVVMVSDHGAMRGTAVELLAGPWRERLEAFLAPAPSAPVAAPQSPPGEAAEPEPETEEDDDPKRPQEPRAVERQRHLRNLSPAERAKVAQSLRLDDRVQLERVFGSTVWELLLRSPHITIPEVARMARKGTLPRPLVEVICDNPQWIRHDIVRRALLTNPRITPEGILKVLRATTARELKLISQQTAYTAQVRAVARKLGGGSD